MSGEIWFGHTHQKAMGTVRSGGVLLAVAWCDMEMARHGFTSMCRGCGEAMLGTVRLGMVRRGLVRMKCQYTKIW